MAFQDPFEQLLTDLGEVFRPQREWVQRRGLVLQFAMFFSAAGGGIWFWSLLFGLNLGLAISLVFIIGSGVTHLVYLGRPGVAWRMFLRPHQAWISRGMLSIALFLITGLLYALPIYFPALPWAVGSAFGRAMLVLSIIAAAWLLIYKGFAFASSKGIASWNTFLVPLIMASGLTGGGGLLLILATATGKVIAVELAEILRLWIILQACTMLLFYLWIVSVGSKELRTLVLAKSHGKVSLAGDLVLLVIGVILLVTGGTMGYATTVSIAGIVFIGALSIAADFHTTYAVSRAGVYRPLIRSSTSI